MRRRMKTILTLAAACTLALACAGCGQSSSQQSSAPESSSLQSSAPESISSTPESSSEANAADLPDNSSEEPSENTPEAEASGGTLIVYFSHSGNTHKLTEMIQAETGAELLRLTPVEPYESDLFDRAQNELNNGIRPKLSELPGQEILDQYDTILLGFPIWWYDLPMPVWTFLENYDLSGKTIIPYFTHNGSSNGAGSLGTVKELCPDSEVRSDDALSVWGNRVDGAESEVKEWIVGIGLSD